MKLGYPEFTVPCLLGSGTHCAKSLKATQILVIMNRQPQLLTSPSLSNIEPTHHASLETPSIWKLDTT